MMRSFKLVLDRLFTEKERSQIEQASMFTVIEINNENITPVELVPMSSKLAFDLHKLEKEETSGEK